MARADDANRAKRGLHPFDVLVVLVIAIGILPIGPVWTRIVWVLVLLAGTLVARHRARAIARAIARAAEQGP